MESDPKFDGPNFGELHLLIILGFDNVVFKSGAAFGEESIR